MSKDYYFVESSAFENFDKKNKNCVVSSYLFKNLPNVENIDIPIIIFKKSMLNEIKKIDIPTKNMEELATAIYYDKNIHPDETIFVTSNYYLSIIANLYFGEDSVIFIPKGGEKK